MTQNADTSQEKSARTHTQGPFDLSMGAGGSGGLFVRDAKRRLIAGFQTTSLSDAMLPDEGEANAQLFIAAGGLLASLRRSAQEHLDMAALLDAWARESVEGSWSTHQVDAQRRRADQCRKYAADALNAIAKAEKP